MRRSIVGFLLVVALLVPLASDGWSQKGHDRSRATQQEHAQIYLIRGLFGVFSTGMDEMAAQLKAQGYTNVTLWSWTDVDQISHDIIAGHQNGDDAHIILIGHSLGSDAVVQVAQRLARENIPVDLAVTFDITENLVVPNNVGRFFNFYQLNGFGRTAVEPAGFPGEFSNIDLSSQTQLRHANIDNAPQLQSFVRQQIYELTHTHVMTVAARRKASPRG
ncbi:hypothetical protein DFP91_4344 [Pseudorhodoplanes sinuspersici]|uniref:Uncharacterized protein n=1 Tax=Pseudorhodoplanes sinuspersici TaxID=1235591 RepID=A0A1W6ZP24_9HYPH|nr:hypothetical protein CAK95_05115 [Pseudorhodoplanes sinuspersici]RKE69899.1 hypothetical protein DFP91_4344 [Pseudorhodoplanes sinuspersici]